jgi:hypothetical protein
MKFFDLPEQEKTSLILEHSKRMEKILNENFLKRFGEMHNIDESSNIFGLKQEVIADNGLFLSVKKKYALHIINKEGVPKDELFIKGMVTERSDYPSITRQKIKRIIEMILTNESINFSKVFDEIKKEENEIYEMCKSRSTAVGRPVKYNSKVYIKEPSHVIAMKLWNRLMYSYFVPGTKGYLFRIKGVDFSKCENKDILDEMEFVNAMKPHFVVVPQEEPILPEFFILDMEAMMNFCWHDRIKEILVPIEKMIQNKKEDKGVLLWE